MKYLHIPLILRYDFEKRSLKRSVPRRQRKNSFVKTIAEIRQGDLDLLEQAPCLVYFLVQLLVAPL